MKRSEDEADEEDGRLEEYDHLRQKRMEMKGGGGMEGGKEDEGSDDEV